ncbi:MAG: DUF1800 domain-containing protein [Chitinophagales bacterium]
MDRRNLLTKPFATIKERFHSEKIPTSQSTEVVAPPDNKYFNSQLPNTARSMAGLEAYSGEFGNEQAAHLLRRCLFGTNKTEIEAAVNRGLQKTIEMLFAEQEKPPPPINYQFPDDPNVPIGETWVTAPITANVNNYRRRSLQNWWFGLMMNQGVSLREKMTLFWHNHLVTELSVVLDAKYGYYYLDLLRTHALGNFKTLAEEITVTPAMLQYLNGRENVKAAPNENYARELFELFTIGKGPLVGNGDYTYYTEEDVIAAAKVLTGWRDRAVTDNGIPGVNFIPNRHTQGNKQFSHRFESYIIEENGAEEYKDLITMIFNKRQTARYLSEKLYRWFVYYVIDEAAYANIIDPMADMLIENSFEVAPVLEALLSSEHFFDSINYGVVIKNPLDFLIGIFKNFNIGLPPLEAGGLIANYRIWTTLAAASENLQMTILNPPSVAGWIAYYQTPQYYQSWITSVTLPDRISYTDLLVQTGLGAGDNRIIINPFNFIAQFESAGDPNELIKDAARILFPKELTNDQYDYLKEVLIPGLPDYEWTVEYNEYLANPDDEALRLGVLTKLRNLLQTMLSLAEYQLS